MAEIGPTPEFRFAPSGIAGLDSILGGGFPADHLHLIEGAPGTGKSTLALQFLLEGVRRGERGLYVSLSETADELRMVARRHGWSPDGIEFFQVTTTEGGAEQSVMFHSSEVELSETTREVLAEVERVQPTLIVIDSLSELRLLAQNSLRFRRQMLALKQLFSGRNCTVLLLDDQTAGAEDLQLQSIAHGVLILEQLAPEYGAERRRLQVRKMRACEYRGGYHDFIIRTGGLQVFPRLVAAEHHQEFPREQLPCGVAELDSLLGGGLERGTSTLVMGPTGVGKSSVVMQYAVAAAERGDRAALYLFDETTRLAIVRAEGLGMPLAAHLQAGRITLQHVDPAELSPGQLTWTIREAVEERGVTLVAIDSINGYLNAMPEERFLTLQLHELLTYLAQQGATTLMVVAQHGIVGNMESPVNASYLADTVLVLRYFEVLGEVRQAISVLKKRTGGHERTLREFRLGPTGIQVGAPLLKFQGILTGVPSLQVESRPRKRKENERRGGPPTGDTDPGARP